MNNQIFSFKTALCGLWYAIRHEAHMRFHLIAGLYVIIFSFFYELSRAQWAAVLLLIGLILASEAFNTSIEVLCDRVSTEQHPLIKASKDTAASAVLVLSAAAVAIAFIFYFDIDKIVYIFNWFIQRPPFLILLLASAAASALFVIKGGVKKQ